MPDPEPTVFIVDDDVEVRDALRLLMKSVGLRWETFDSAKAFLETYDPDRPGCLVLDVRMPWMTGLDLQQKLNEHGALLPIIFITGHGDVPMAVDAMRAGAVDFIQKPFRDHDLLTRINEALEQDATSRRIMLESDSIAERLTSLTAREREVLDLVIEGTANKVIAMKLGVSQRTVEIHRSHVMEKMQAKTVPHLVRMVMTAQD